MSVALDIPRTYRAPLAVPARRMAGAPREDRALVLLFVACGLIFTAQLPRLAREAVLDPSIPFDGRMAGALFGWMLMMPLVFYALSLAVHGVLRFAGAGATGYRVRVALFWALLASTPLWLLAGLMAGFAGGKAAATLCGGLALAAFLGFSATGLVAAVRTGQEVTA